MSEGGWSAISRGGASDGHTHWKRNDHLAQHIAPRTFMVPVRQCDRDDRTQGEAVDGSLRPQQQLPQTAGNRRQEDVTTVASLPGRWP
jgi:hypothetical protein